MDRVLDLDLDFFVWPIQHNLVDDCRLPASDCEYISSENDVRLFLEERCHLDSTEPVLGQQFAEHEDAFKVWRRWIGEGKLTYPFEVVHVDAHGDLGAGWPNNTSPYLETILARPVNERANPDFSPRAVNSGNYLTFAIANRWISSLTYVFPTDPLASTRHLSRIDRVMMLDHGSQCEMPPVRDVPAWCFQSSQASWWEQPMQLGADEPDVHFETIRKEDFDGIITVHAFGCRAIAPVHAEMC